MKVMTEPEITYQLSLFKQKMSKNKDSAMLHKLHKRVCHSIKVLTQQTVESFQPICNVLIKNETVTKENITLLLYRLQKLYAVKQDGSKILNMVMKLDHDP